MLKKDLMVPGTTLRINKIKWGIPGYPDSIETLPMFPNDFYLDGCYQAKPGETMSVIKGPRKRQNINALRVKLDSTGQEFEVYWCTIRNSASIVEK